MPGVMAWRERCRDDRDTRQCGNEEEGQAGALCSELSEQPRWSHRVRDASRDQNCDQQLHRVVLSEAGLTTCFANPLMASIRLHEMTLCANVISEGVSDAG